MSNRKSRPLTQADDLIWTNPQRMGGIPCVFGTRVPVDQVESLLYDCTDEEINRYYPSVTVEQAARIRALRAQVGGTA